ncbi:MAG: indolepyruvate ferredoxin oxidoreductase family protein [Rhodospirillales bacterium]
MQLRNVSLDDKYMLEDGSAFMTGTQALVRLPLIQRQRDLAAGLNTAGYISGYRGSPLGAYDQQLWSARKHLASHHIVFRPGLNEDLAATAIWGAQQIEHSGEAKYDGVFGIWYGKGPGVDRSGDVFKHANQAGSARHGGVIALGGDDHMAKSSTVAHQSEFAFVDALMPIFSPAGVQEFLDYGLHGFAMSRFSGLWAGFKAIGETVDSSAVVDLDPERVRPILPQFDMPEGGLNNRQIITEFLMLEEMLHRYKLPAAKAYARENRLDRVVIGGPERRIGIVTVGKSYLDVRQAFDELGLTETEAARLGVSLYKVAMPWPLETDGARAFCEGLDLVIVVEEKRGLIEPQLKEALYGLSADRRPQIIGKQDEVGQELFPAYAELSPGMIARALAERLKILGMDEQGQRRIDSALARYDRLDAAAAGNQPPSMTRTPYFCSGCPHNTSTKVPEGSRAGAGIGCHYMSLWMDRDTSGFTHMGAEGANWVGQAPFVETPHIFQNIGDGTYNHSGLLAIRQAAAAGVNITYKILYNDAVAMTGGQPHDGTLSVAEISRQVHAEGAKRIVVVTDEPDKYPSDYGFAPGVTVHHRRELMKVQRELRETQGLTVLIYDQTCAAEKRRRRKRGTFPNPPKRAFINERVCEGCGDCGVKSNCVSVAPIETEYGRKRRIDQSACNKDYSCMQGFCPSFVTVLNGEPRKSKPVAEDPQSILPAPDLPSLEKPYGILLTGIGGTGVVTVNAVLAMAAHLEGKAATVLDMAGLAQKGGAVWSHLRIAEKADDLHATRIALGGADLLLGCDIVTAAQPDSIAKLERGNSKAVINTYRQFTGDFTRDPDFQFPTDELKGRIEGGVGPNSAYFLDGTELATKLMGDSIATNLFMTGYAWQKGLIPLAMEAILKAIELNGVGVEMNTRSFHWGRMAAYDLSRVETAAGPKQKIEKPLNLEETVSDRVSELTAYQNARYARKYKALVDKVSEAEQSKVPGQTTLAMAAAKYAYKLMAYKDEYEVARLYTDPSFRERLEAQFEGDFEIRFNLAPPLLSKIDPVTGEPIKKEFGPSMEKWFRRLSKLKVLRGTRLDIFGRTEERKRERALIDEYWTLVDKITSELTPENHKFAVGLLSVPEHIRGYGHVKLRNLDIAKAEEGRLLAAFENPNTAKFVQAAE